MKKYSIFLMSVLLSFITAPSNLANSTEKMTVSPSQTSAPRQISGTIVFNLTESLYKKIYDYYPGTFKKTGSYQNINYGKREWTQYLVIRPDGRVVKLDPNDRAYVGDVVKCENGVITILIKEQVTIGEHSKLWRNGKKTGSIGSIGGYYKRIVIDTKTKCIYGSESDYKNRDISNVEYYMYDSFLNEIKESNNTTYVNTTY